MAIGLLGKVLLGGAALVGAEGAIVVQGVLEQHKTIAMNDMVYTCRVHGEKSLKCEEAQRSYNLKHHASGPSPAP